LTEGRPKADLAAPGGAGEFPHPKTQTAQNDEGQHTRSFLSITSRVGLRITVPCVFRQAQYLDDLREGLEPHPWLPQRRRSMQDTRTPSQPPREKPQEPAAGVHRRTHQCWCQRSSGRPRGATFAVSCQPHGASSRLESEASAVPISILGATERLSRHSVFMSMTKR